MAILLGFMLILGLWYEMRAPVRSPFRAPPLTIEDYEEHYMSPYTAYIMFMDYEADGDLDAF
jgi:hypothetical protein